MADMNGKRTFSRSMAIIQRKRGVHASYWYGLRNRKDNFNTCQSCKGLLPQMVLKGGKGHWRILPQRVLKRKGTEEITATDGSTVKGEKGQGALMAQDSNNRI